MLSLFDSLHTKITRKQTEVNHQSLYCFLSFLKGIVWLLFGASCVAIALTPMVGWIWYVDHIAGFLLGIVTWIVIGIVLFCIESCRDNWCAELRRREREIEKMTPLFGKLPEMYESLKGEVVKLPEEKD